MEGQENVQNVETKEKTKKNKSRMLLVLIFLAIFIIVSYVQLRGSYLEYLELGESYVDIFHTNLTYRYGIMAISFVILYFIIYWTNNGIKKGLKPFFEKENKPMPKLLNKSIALIISVLASIVVSVVFMHRIMLLKSMTSFGMQDPIYGMDIAYYIFQKPVIEMILTYLMVLVIGLSIYTALYYIIVFNRYFDGVEGKMLKESRFLKSMLKNAMTFVVLIAIMTLVKTQNMVYGKILTISNELEIIGAGITEATIKLWGYIVFSVVIVVFAYRAIKSFKQGNTNKVLKNLAVIPGYLVVLFLIMMLFDLLYVKSNELDKQKDYISENIKNTKNAYNINIDEENLENSGTITSEEVEKNSNVIENIPVINSEAVLTTVKDSQTVTGHFKYVNANLAKYNINGKDELVYIAPREITNSGRTYNNKTYEYTHGMGTVIASATQSTEAGNVQYIQKDVSGKDEVINLSEPRIYFGMETRDIIATNAKNKEEYDYTDENGTDYASNYQGKAGLQLNFFDRLILGMAKGDINLAFSGEITGESKILMNRQIIERAKKALPYLIYDENPYTVITEEGKIVWVIDAYTVSASYPYSQYTSIEHDGTKQKINYIRNSVKVIVDSYDGTMQFYITDKSDPIAMAYNKIYSKLFMPLNSKIPDDIANHTVYPEFLYNVQSKVLKTYHNVKPDILYRTDDLWDIIKYSSIRNSKSVGTYMKPYYTMLKTPDGEKFGLVQMYTQNEKQNIIAYLVGSTENGENKLKLYKFSADSNIVGPMQLDKQIEEDEAISVELNALSITGTRLTKQMIIVPIENTLLYVEPIYQTMLNESDVPVLKKVVVASGNKVAIGNDLPTALENLLSQYAVDIKVENTEDIQGLIEAIIKANQNLTESNVNNNWEMMGKDIQKLQELITSLENVKKEEDKKKEADKSNVSTEINKDDEVNDSLNNKTTDTNISSRNTSVNQENK